MYHPTLHRFPLGCYASTRSIKLTTLPDNNHPIIRRITSLYGAYAPDFNLSAYGNCRDEALNNLTDEIRQRQEVLEPTGDERKHHAQR